MSTFQLVPVTGQCSTQKYRAFDGKPGLLILGPEKKGGSFDTADRCSDICFEWPLRSQKVQSTMLIAQSLIEPRF